MEDLKKLIEEISSRKPKNYEQMKIEVISKELHNKNDLQKYNRKRNYLNSRNIFKKNR